MRTLRETFNASAKREALLKELANGLVASMAEQGWFKSCLNCDHWEPGVYDSLGKLISTANGPGETCRLYKARPPANVIVVGCSSHSDEIPF